MHFLLFATLTGTVLAKSYLAQLPNTLQARQESDAFIPGSSGVVVNCPTPCGEDCLRISRGDTCCAEGYGCPGGSFCLTNGYCCPDGDDPATCARNNGITLPSGFKAGNTVAPGTASSTPAATTPTPVPSPSAVSVSTPPPVSVSTPPPEAATTLPAPPLYATPSNSTVPAATDHATSFNPALPSTTVVPFTGAASSMRFAAEGGIVAVFFAAGAFSFLL